ncbi:kynureninase [Cumulibacter manganitolerans]|uniref:kynureninase n=1 Tax=Cumulibacter manganitolerans TaxID=1884992 RepID=UPI001296FE45|nr:aminotransferase class V-fold PLP-dependent enzyme [Cumulibacter manganitolerans]
MPTNDAPPYELSRDFARALDAQNPLRAHRELFVRDDATVYLDGNSLGRLPRATADRLATVVRDEWGRDLIQSWPRWLERCTTVADRLGRAVLGVDPGQVALADSTTVSLFKVLSAAIGLRPGRRTILIEADSFPTDHYVVQGLARQHGMRVVVVQSDIDGGLSPAQVEAVLSDDVALACFCHVSYRSGALADMTAITALLHARGALAVWDLCHSAGAVRTPLAESDADFAVGCTYKYLNSGPGAPAFLYVRRDLISECDQPIWGWFGQADQFAMGQTYEPVETIERFLSGTPPMLGVTAVEEGVRTIADAGIEALETGGRLLTGYALKLTDEWLAPLGWRVASPRPAGRRGAHLTLHHAAAWQVNQALIARGIVPDFRTPDRLRLGMAPLTTSFEDVWAGFDAIREITHQREYERYPAERARVT